MPAFGQIGESAAMGSRTPGLSWLRRPETVRRRVGLWALITWLVVAVSMSLMALPGAAGIKALTYNQTVLADQPVGVLDEQC